MGWGGKMVQGGIRLVRAAGVLASGFVLTFATSGFSQQRFDYTDKIVPEDYPTLQELIKTGTEAHKPLIRHPVGAGGVDGVPLLQRWLQWQKVFVGGGISLPSDVILSNTGFSVGFFDASWSTFEYKLRDIRFGSTRPKPGEKKFIFSDHRGKNEIVCSATPEWAYWLVQTTRHFDGVNPNLQMELLTRVTLIEHLEGPELKVEWVPIEMVSVETIPKTISFGEYLRMNGYKDFVAEILGDTRPEEVRWNDLVKLAREGGILSDGSTTGKQRFILEPTEDLTFSIDADPGKVSGFLRLAAADGVDLDPSKLVAEKTTLGQPSVEWKVPGKGNPRPGNPMTLLDWVRITQTVKNNPYPLPRQPNEKMIERPNPRDIFTEMSPPKGAVNAVRESELRREELDTKGTDPRPKEKRLDGRWSKRVGKTLRGIRK
ncbi:MAG: hypothetical protein V1495_05415 [Pseudomonadota bacterium]